MKISKSKQELARIISENGGWREGAEFAWFQGNLKGGPCHEVWFGEAGSEPEYVVASGSFHCYWSMVVDKFSAKKFDNWHQAILSRAEYLHLYPAPDADGWIEWSGGDCPVGEGDRIDVKFSDGDEFFDVGSDWDWGVDAGGCNIIAYRLHKQEKKSISSDDVNLILVVDGEEHEIGQVVEVKEPDAKPEFCESVMRSIPEPEAKPTIEQLAADYRNAKDYADRKQQEADAAKVDAEDKLKALKLAGKEYGLLVSPIAENMASQKPHFRGDDW